MGESDGAPEWIARRLLRSARQATLATQSGGQPFAGLVTPATAPDGTLLLLLSDLSEHTRHLRSDPRCAVLITGAAAEPNPQTAPRVTVLGAAVIDNALELRRRFLAIHPYAELYAGFSDFNLWRVQAGSAAFVGGFARAFRLSTQALAPDPAGMTAIDAASGDIIAHCNADHADTMALLAGSPAGQMVGVDVDGCDIAGGDLVRRVSWSHPAESAHDVRRELIGLARAARASATPGAAPDR